MTDSGVLLTSFDVDGLFDQRSFTVNLNSGVPTVLTGANGTGKSTLLRLIAALSRADVPTIASAPLRQFTLNFESIPSFNMTRREGGFQIVWGEHTGLLSLKDDVLQLPSWALVVLEEYGFDPAESLNHLSDTAQSSGVPFAEYRESRQVIEDLREGGAVLTSPDWLGTFGESFPVLFVTDQRLVAEPSKRRLRGRLAVGNSSRIAVEAAGDDLAEQIRNADSNYARASQLQDRDFPQLLVAAFSQAGDVSNEVIQSLVGEVDEMRSALRQVGLLDDDFDFAPDVAADNLEDRNLRLVMGEVLKANRQKFEVLGDLQARLSAFKNFLDGRLAPKSVRLSRSDGMRFELPSGQSIRPRQLSSGEQQITVLAYEILFRAQPQTLVIIDEPEISLHVLWQDTLIDDLIRMGSPSNLQFLLATHSPVIIAGRPDLERSLSQDS